MRIQATVALGGIALMLGACGAEQTATAPKGPPNLTTEQIAGKSKYGLAYITAEDPIEGKTAATGFVIESNPQKTLILTAEHAVGQKIRVGIGNQAMVSGRLVGRAGCQADAALIEVSTPPRVTVLPISKAPARLGQRVIAMGYSSMGSRRPKEAAVKEGRISRANARNVEMGPDAPQLAEAYQTDAALNPADSGGPLVNSSGAVVGLNVAKQADADNVGFALKLSYVQPLIDQMREGDGSHPGWTLIPVDRSFPYRDFVSAVYSDVSPRLASVLGSILRDEKLRGLLMVDAEEGRPASKLPQGVLIESLNGTDVKTMTDVCRVWSSVPQDSHVRVTGKELFAADGFLGMLDPFRGRVHVPE